MKTLLIIRHAKSSWEDASLDDFDRPLNDRGLRNGPEMAKRLRCRALHMDGLLSSSSVRTRQTVAMLAPALAIDAENIWFRDVLYHASPSVCNSQVHTLSERWSRAVVVGHNPGLTYWVNKLAGIALDNVPTLGMAFIQFPEAKTWEAINTGRGELVWYDYPKQPFPDVR